MTEHEALMPHENLKDWQRLVMLLGGGGLMLTGLGRRTPAGWALALAGAYLFYRGTGGSRRLSAALGIERVEQADEIRGLCLEHSVTIDQPREALYRYWRALESLPTIMKHLESVQVLPDGRSHWVARAPVTGTRVEWDAEIVAEREGELISWRALSGADLANTGMVVFRDAPARRGTEVHVELTYDPPAGPLGLAVARLLGEVSEQHLKDDLRRFKQLMETGLIPTIEGQPVGPPRGPLHKLGIK